MDPFVQVASRVFDPPAHAGGTDWLSQVMAICNANRQFANRKLTACVTSPLILPLNRFDLTDAFTMAIFGEIGGQPGAHYLTHLIT